MMKFVTLTAIFLLIMLQPTSIGMAVDPPEGEKLLACVDRIEEEKAVFILEDGTSLALPSSLLGSPLKEGDCLNITFVTDAASKDSLEKAASVGLSELLGEPR